MNHESLVKENEETESSPFYPHRKRVPSSLKLALKLRSVYQEVQAEHGVKTGTEGAVVKLSGDAWRMIPVSWLAGIEHLGEGGKAEDKVKGDDLFS